MGKGQKLYQKAKKIIPGGTQLLSKRPEMHLPDFWPSYYSKAKGCEVWDLDGKKYIDMSFMAIGAAVLGYADPDVNKAVKAAVDRTAATTLNCPEEVELAELMIGLHPWADMARFACSGGEVISIAIRIARAKTGREKVMFCGYHGWHDWYLAANLANDKALDGQHLPGLDPTGVPRSLKGTALPFAYNDTKKFLELIEKNKGDVAAVIMEPIRSFVPEKEFIETIRRETKKHGIVLIIDEVSLGFRIANGGSHLKLGIHPDMATYAKALGNGFPIAAVIGKKEIMDVAQETFISSTNWTNNIGFTAGVATVKKFKAKNVSKHLEKMGKAVRDGWEQLAEKHGLEIHTSGTYPIGHFGFEVDKPLVLKTLFTQLMLEEGFLATTAFYASYAHKDIHVKKYLKAVDKVFGKIAKILEEGKPEKYLKGKVCHSGFFRLA
jgi:glutamate-1-semialdehyde aminotransferase